MNKTQKLKALHTLKSAFSKFSHIDFIGLNETSNNMKNIFHSISFKSSFNF